MVVDGQAVGAVKDEDGLNRLLEELKAKYTSENTVSVEFMDTLTIEPVYEAENLMTLSEMRTALQANQGGSTTYTVVAGDTFYGIAYANDMSMSDLEALNPGIDINRLMVGDVLNVKELTPVLSVQTVEEVTYTQSIPCPVEEVEDCIISSVVPPVFNAVCTGVIKLTGLNPMVVGPGIKTGLNIQMDDPASVGSDRIVIAVAALLEYAPPLLLVDLGTATTIEVVDQGNTYLGGAIMPGVRVSAEALSSRAAQLPGIQLDRPRRLIGKNTVECMRSGIMYGAAAMLDGMIERMEEELGKSTTVVATGGMAQFVAPLCKREMMVEKDLLLKGLNAIYKKNKK